MARSQHVPTPADEVAMITLINPQVDSAEAALQDRVLVGKIFAPKVLNRVGVKNNLWKMWDNMQGLHVMDLASNVFAITLPNKNQAGLVLAKAPWYVMGHLLSLQPLGEDQASMEISFNKVPFWVQASNYFIELPTDSDSSSQHEVKPRLDQATETELIQTWNARCNLKRDREVKGTLTEVEEELLRRKKQKREAWFDDAGNVVCVAITTPEGIQIYVPDEDGNLVPPSP